MRKEHDRKPLFGMGLEKKQLFPDVNLVGPLANPLDLETQLMGLYRVELQEIKLSFRAKMKKMRLPFRINKGNGNDLFALYMAELL